MTSTNCCTAYSAVKILITFRSLLFDSTEVPRITVVQQVVLVAVGGDAALECQARGVPSPLVHWFKGKLKHWVRSKSLYD